MRERSLKDDETDYYTTQLTTSTSLGVVSGSPAGTGRACGRPAMSARVTLRLRYGLGLSCLKVVCLSQNMEIKVDQY